VGWPDGESGFVVETGLEGETGFEVADWSELSSLDAQASATLSPTAQTAVYNPAKRIPSNCKLDPVLMAKS
jgi:hypothetical protein